MQDLSIFNHENKVDLNSGKDISYVLSRQTFAIMQYYSNQSINWTPCLSTSQLAFFPFGRNWQAVISIHMKIQEPRLPKQY